MKKTLVFLAIVLALSSPLHPQEDARQIHREACMDACIRERPNPELQRQEVVALEKETARAIQLGDATFFRRVYSDDFSGLLSHGQTVDKAGWIAAVQAPDIKYEAFMASDVKVRLYRDIAVATSLWSIRAFSRNQRIDSQMRVIHVYMYTGGGYRAVTAQTTLLPPYIQQPL